MQAAAAHLGHTLAAAWEAEQAMLARLTADLARMQAAMDAHLARLDALRAEVLPCGATRPWGAAAATWQHRCADPACAAYFEGILKRTGGRMTTTKVEAQVYRAISDITAALAKTGIAKGRANEQQGYKFRGIDECYNALAPLLAEHRLVILPRMTERGCVERQTRSGAPLFYVTVRAEFDFVSALDGSAHTVVTYGEAMDTADKATNKAMSQAFKYAVMQAFCIPVKGELPDADAVTHDVAPAPLVQQVRDLAHTLGVDVAKIAAAFSVETLDDLDDAAARKALAQLQRKQVKGKEAA